MPHSDRPLHEPHSTYGHMRQGCMWPPACSLAPVTLVGYVRSSKKLCQSVGGPANEPTLAAQSSSVSRWMVAKAIWNGATLAESDQCIVVEDTYYFPPEAVNR